MNRQLERNVARLWTVGDVAEYLGVSNSWVYKAVSGNVLPVRRVGALLRFDPEAITSFATGASPVRGGGHLVRLDADRRAGRAK